MPETEEAEELRLWKERFHDKMFPKKTEERRKKMHTVILACSSLKDYVEEAQKKVRSNFPVIYLDRIYHRDPKEMQEHILAALRGLPETTETVLVAMGYCGGSWENVQPPCRLVIPKIDDCVSLLLQMGDTPSSNLKKPGHLYVREKDPSRECFHAIFERLTENLGKETKERYHNDWKQLYSGIDIMDTGLNDCRRPEYREEVQKDADWLEAELSYVPGGTHLLEKLFAGKWDRQFLVLQKDEKVEKSQILENL